MQSQPTPSRNILAHAGLIILLLYFGYIYRGILFLNEGVPEHDGFYHARYAQLLPERGLSRQLPWMQFTDWKDRFCDKDFLYHVYLAAFTRNAAEPLPGAKYGTLLLLLAALAAIYIVLRKWNAPFPLLWVALAGAGSAHFITRMLMVRSHTLSVVLMIVSVHVILKRRFWPCFALAVLYAWSYSVPLAMLVAACAMEFGRFMVKPVAPTFLSVRRWKESARLPLATAAGLLVGLAAHPYTPHSLISIWMFFKIIWSGAAGSEVELGSEFRHMTAAAAFTVSIGTTIAALIAFSGALALHFRAIKNRALSPETAAVVAISTAWFISMFVSFERFIEYAAPTACLACAFVARDLLGPLPPLKQLTESSRIKLFAAMGLAAMVLAGLHAFTFDVAQAGFVDNSQPPYPKPPAEPTPEAKQAWYRGRFFEGAATWMKSNLKPGTVVANFYWDDFPELFYDAPEMYYLVGLDPTFMRLSHRDESLALESMRTHKSPVNLAKIKSMFGTSYIIFRKRRAVEYEELFDRETHRFKPEAAGGKIVFEDRLSLIYEVP